MTVWLDCAPQHLFSGKKKLEYYKFKHTLENSAEIERT